ncbi:MAG: hypothetical protein ACKVRO_07615 [Micropepsaceae bacterium]
MTDMSPELREEIESVLIAAFGDLRLIDEADEPNVVGSFPLLHDGEIIDRFRIKISFPDAYPFEPPIVREVGQRIPHVPDRHNSNGVACLFVPIEWKMKRPDLRFRTFMTGPVHNYFLSQRYFEIHKEWPFGERDHGVFGEVEAACDLVGVALERWNDLFSMLIKADPRGHWKCPCGSGERLRNCHIKKILALREHATADWAQKKIDQLREHAEERRKLKTAA